MDIARLQVVVSTEESRRQVAALRADLVSLTTAANTTATGAQQQINRIGTSARQASNTVRTAARDMEREFTGSLRRISGLIAGAFSIQQITRFGSEAVKTNIEFRRMENILTGLTGSTEAAKEQMAFLAAESDRLGLNFRAAGQAFVRFEAAAKGSTITEGQLRNIFIQTSEAAIKLGATTAQQERIFTAYQQMISKGVVSMEELRQQLGDSLPGAFQIGARAMGVTTRQFMQMVESGKLLTQDFLPKFAQQLKSDVSGSVDQLAVSLGKAQNAWDKFKNAIGEQVRPAVQAGANAVTTAFNDAALGIEYSQWVSGVKGNDPLTVSRALRKKFPDATGPKITPNFVGGLNFGTSFDSFAEYRRMRAEDTLSKTAGPVGSGEYKMPDFGLNLPSLPAQEDIDPQTLSRYEKELQRLTLDRLDGRARIIESYRQEHAAVVALGLPLNKEAQLTSLINENMAKALNENSMQGLAEQARSLSDEMTDLTAKSEKLFLDVLASGAAEAEKINAQFRENLNLLIQLEEYGANTNGVTYEDLVRSRDQALSELESKSNRSMMGGRGRETPTFEGVLASWGTLEQRMKVGGAELANSLDQNFTDAFSSMIMGTQSVSEAFKNMATSIVSDLVRIMVQQMIVRSIMQLGGAIGTADAGVDSPSVVKSRMTSDIRGAYVQHDGGVVGGYAEGSVRRLHNGGVAGDEATVVARRGEVFFTPEQMKMLGSTISGAMPRSERKVEVVNVMDPEYFTRALVKNKNTIFNIIGSDSKTLRRTIS